jgi:hypothetical protein
VASAAAHVRPKIVPVSGGHEIHGLQPNTLVEFDISCRPCARTELEAFRRVAVSVEAPGKVIEADPRSTMFARFLNNTLRVIGLAR